MSNILSVFNPPPSRQLDTNEVNCLPCTFIQSMFATGGGIYLNSNIPFKGTDGKVDFKKHPIWWQKSVRGIGILLIGLGAYRFGEVAQMVYRDKFE
ncbi:hypothetical protein CAAN1_01S07998 [[Candida] anglica]|uniref:DUF4536 domain-containing protein n=1 Tax=[Candida] anglica TaxID=148631 RepID=A0ABP0EJZ7_9ASCO